MTRSTVGTVYSGTAVAARPAVAGRAWGRFLCGFAAIWCALQLLGAGALTTARGVGAFLVVALVAACVERLLLGTSRAQLVDVSASGGRRPVPRRRSRCC